MRTLRFSLLLLVAVSAAVDAGAADAPTPATSAATTRVITFQPSIPTSKHRRGECWTESAAVDRPEAWRCARGNAIFDPCFSVDGLKKAVVCGADPARHQAGFVLELIKPLPQRSPPHPIDDLPWLLELDDGSTCERTTGTSAMVDGEVVPYQCSDSKPCDDKGCPYITGVTTKLTRGLHWSADKMAFRSTSRGLELIKRTAVPITTVWQ